MLGEVEITKIPEKNRGPKQAAWMGQNVGFGAFFGLGPIFRKKRLSELNQAASAASAASAEWSHGPQDKPREPCACFPDYGRRTLNSLK